jgi:hypothetical protein
MLLMHITQLGVGIISSHLLPNEVNIITGHLVFHDVAPACNDPFVKQVRTGISTIVSLLLGLGIAISVIGVLVGGLMRATSFGNERKIAASNTAITCAVIGLVIVLLSVTFGNAVPGWFGATGCQL